MTTTSGRPDAPHGGTLAGTSPDPRDGTPAVPGARILFVDDDPSVLDGLRRQLWRRGAHWELLWATGATEALSIMKQRPVDVLVTDMQMSGMSGPELLEEVRVRYPGTARLVLSGHADHEAIIAAAGPAQQYLTKPCKGEMLDAALTSAVRAARVMHDPELRSLFGGLASLPKPPRIYTELTALLRRPTTTVSTVAQLVQQDVSTTTEVLKLVNSSFFGLASNVTSIDRAVTLLGLDVIQALVLAGSLFAPGGDLPAGLSGTDIAERGMRACLAARRIGQVEGWDGPCQSHLGLAALLHDVGLLVLACAYPDRWARLRDADPSIPAREREVAAFGCTIGQSSAYLLELWAFPHEVVAALALQPIDLHEPSQRATASLNAVVLAFARAAVTEGSPDLTPDPDDGYLTTHRLAAWTPD